MARARGDDAVEDEVDLDDELEEDLLDGDDEGDGLDDDDADEDGLPEGFSVVGEGDAVEEDDDPAAIPVAAVREAEDRAVDVITAVGRDAVEDEEEDELAVRRAGEFVCSRCHLVKRDTQLARPRLRICRDCA